MARKSSTGAGAEEAAAPTRKETGIPLQKGSAFQGVEGQEAALKVLRAALQNGRLSHAYLFLGPAGVGRELVARRLAAAVLCSGRTPDMKPDEVCGTCTACSRVDRGLHPDVHLCLTEADAVRRGAAWDEERKPSLELKVDQIRQVREAMRMTAFEGGWRITIIPQADKLRVEAANALLKTLEEPLPNSLIVLCAPDRGSVLETLRSRCQRINFSPLPQDLIARLVAARRGLEAGVARALAETAEGSLGAALEGEPEEAQALTAQARELLEALQAETPSELVSRAESLESERDHLDVVVRALMRVARTEAETLLGGARTQGAEASRARQLLDVASNALQLRMDLQKPGANARLNLEHFMLRMRAALTDSRTAR